MSSFALRGLRVVNVVDDRRIASRPTSHERKRAPLGQFLVGVAAAGVLLTSPADAGVILQQPTLKRLATTENKTASTGSSAPSSFDFNLDIGSISLPLTLAGCVGLYVVASKLDNGFDSFMTDAWVKDSAVNGVGYEEEINNSVNGGEFRKRRR